MAPRTIHVLSTCLLCLFRAGKGQTLDGPTEIDVTPATLTVTPNASDSNGQVTISCKAFAVEENGLMAIMKIERVPHSNPYADPVVVAQASLPRTPNAVLKLTSLEGSATVTGRLLDKTITLTLNRPNCSDAGKYICYASAIVNEANAHYRSSNYLTIEVSPGSITMTTEPSGVSNWRVNDTLLMRCNGIVGTVLDDSQLEWVWQYQDAGFPAQGNWTKYANIGEPDIDIHTYSAILASNSCYKRQTSELTRRLSEDDSDREYRCYVINHGVSGGPDPEGNAQVYSVGTLSESVPTQTDVGVIIGAVVAVVIVIAVVILAVVFKRRMMGAAAHTMSEETRGTDNQTSSVGNARRPVEQRLVEQGPVEQSPVTTAENPNLYDGLIMEDGGEASLHQDLGSPCGLSR